MSVFSVSTVFTTAAKRMHGVIWLVWMHLLCAVLLALFALGGLHAVFDSPAALELINGPYMPLYGLVLILFVPFVCFAIKTVMERDANRPYVFGYIYAAAPLMMSAFGWGGLIVIAFYGAHCLQVWGSLVGWHGAVFVLIHALQLVIFLLGSCVVLASLRRPVSFAEAFQQGLTFFRRHAWVLFMIALCVCVLFALVFGLANWVHHAFGRLGALLGFSIRGIFELAVIPYLVVVLGVIGTHMTREGIH